MKTFLFFSLLFLASNIFGQQMLTDRLELLSKEDPTEAIILADSLLFENNFENKEIKNKVFHFKALAYYNNYTFDKALATCDEIVLKDQKSELYIKILLLKSACNTALNDFTSASNQAITALNISEENKLDEQQSKALNSLSYLHYLTKEYDKSFFYLNKSVRILKATSDSVELSATYNNMAIIYKNISQFDSAIFYNRKSLEISELLRDQVAISKSYSNIGRVYEMIGNQENALYYFSLAEQNNAKHDIENSIPYRNKADLLLEYGQFIEAEKYFLKALKIEQIEGNASKTYNLYNNLLKVAIAQKDFNKTVTYQAKLDSVQKVKSLEENDEKIKILENQYKLKSNERKLEQERSINTKNKIIFVSSFIVLFLLVLFLFQRNKTKELKLQQEKARLEQKVLRSQMNPHFIFNALSAIQNSLLDNEPIKSASYLSKFAKLIRQNFDFINLGEISLAEELDALKNYIETQQMRFADKFDYEFIIDEMLILENVNIPPLLLQPFIENAIEHGFKNLKKKGFICLSISKQDEKIFFEIKDNGIGFDINERNDGKEHAIDVFKKRLNLLNNSENNSLEITTTTEGTIIKFYLEQ